MDLYVWRLTHIGFSTFRAYEVFLAFRRDNDFEGLDKYISDLEMNWETGSCG